MGQVNDVLAQVDANHDAALARLFNLLRIKSISTDPAYHAACLEAAEACRAMLGEAGFEASVRDGKISISSPIARALIGKAKNDSVEVVTPKGARSYEILKIEWK